MLKHTIDFYNRQIVLTIEPINEDECVVTRTDTNQCIVVKNYGCDNPACYFLAKMLIDKDRIDIAPTLKAFCKENGYSLDNIHDAVKDYEYCEKVSKDIVGLFTKKELDIFYHDLFDEELCMEEMEQDDFEYEIAS